MTNVLNSQFDGYVNHLATGLEGGALKQKSTTITVNLEGLKDNIAQYNSALQALDSWSAVTCLTFKQVSGTTAANITFNNDGRCAVTSWNASGAKIDVSQNWMGSGDPAKLWGTGSYGLQTFIHEIGHALGLDHGGEYNGSASYSSDRMFDIDTWQYSVMSYFNQTNYTANNASYLDVDGPMLADIAAIQKLYGKLAVNAGDTVWGAGSSLLMGATDFGINSKASYAIHDTGGYDTFDLSNAKTGSVIDLRPGYFSDINGYKGNVGIAADTIIERVFGTAFNDTIHGNAADNAMFGNAGNDTLYAYEGNDDIWGGAGNDILDGGTGTDVMHGGAGDDTYYVDSAQDVVDEQSDNGSGRDKVISTVSFSLSANPKTAGVEDLTLGGTANINATGNTLNNRIIGNAGNNVIDGGIGQDRLTGGAGHDIFVFGANYASDLKTGKVGMGTIQANSDIVTDFHHGEDLIALSLKTFAAFTGYKVGDVVRAENFLSYAYAQTAKQFLLYDKSTGTLWYDENGNAAVDGWTGRRPIATFTDDLGKHPLAMDTSDFVFVA